MNNEELSAKRAFLNVLARSYRADSDYVTANALSSIADDLQIYENMPRITFEGDSSTAKCGDGAEDTFQIDDHHKCVSVICRFDDNGPALAGLKFSRWLQKIAAKGDKT